MKKKTHLLYKIFYSDAEGNPILVYIGRTNQPLKARLRGHFTAKPMMRKLDPNAVCRIEYAEFETEADMFLYEIYYINLLKPSLNRDDKSKEPLTIELPPALFKPVDLTELGLCQFQEKANEQDRILREKAKERVIIFQSYMELKEKRRRLMAQAKADGMSPAEQEAFVDSITIEIDTLYQALNAK